MSSHAPPRGVSSKTESFPPESPTVTAGGFGDGAPSADLERGARVGRYLVLDDIGRGAMGTVFRAYDPELDRKVALKLLHAGKTNDEVRTRLLREAQALAQLSHPNVVSIFDVGTVDDRVFLAMELVVGRTLGRVLATDTPSWQRSLELLIAAGRGLAAAHAAGLVHRDFKPENVMVGDDGRVRVLDFGLARGTEVAVLPADAELRTRRAAESTDRHLLSSPLTETGAFLGTPNYMAPEQFLGEAVGPRADQFSFCVVLHQALFGERPYPGNTIESLLETILQEKYVDPPWSSGVPARLRAVVRRGLRVEPEDRYPSMDALLDDLARSAGKWPRWMPGALSVTALVALAGIATFVRAPAKADPCADVRKPVDDVWNVAAKDGMAAAFEATGRAHAKVTFARTSAALDAYATTWGEHRTDACRVATARRAPSTTDELRVACLTRRASAMTSLVRVLSKEPDARVVDEAVNASLSLPPIAECSDDAALVSAVAPEHDPAKLARIAPVESSLDDAEALLAAGKYKAGLELATPALEASRALGYAPLTARAAFAIGALDLGAGELTAGRGVLDDAVAFASQAHDDKLTARAYTLLVETLLRDGKLDDAAVWVKPANAAVLRAGDDDVLRARLLHKMAWGAAQRGQVDDARSYAERSYALSLAALGPSHSDVGRALIALGNIVSMQGRRHEAIGYYERALEVQTKVLGPEHPSLASTSLRNLAMELGGIGRYEEGKGYAKRALAIQTATLGADHPDTAATVVVLGSLLLENGELDKARDVVEQSLATLRRVLGEDGPDLIYPLANLGEVAFQEGRFDEARKWLEASLALRAKTLPPGHPETLSARANLLIFEVETGARREARATAALLPPLPKQVPATDGTFEQSIWYATAVERAAQGNVDEADAILARLAVVEEASRDETPRLVTRALDARAGFASRAGRFADAEKLYADERALAATRLGASHPDVARAILGIARAKLAQGGAHRDGAAELVAEADGILHERSPTNRLLTEARRLATLAAR